MNNTIPRPVPWPVKATFLALLLGTLALIFLWPVEAQGQALTPGVGLPGAPPEPNFRRQWCIERVSSQAPPPTTACSHRAPEGFDCRLCSIKGWLGFGNEDADKTTLALRTCWERNLWGTRDTHAGVPTQAEFDWAVVNWSRTRDEYRECYYETWHEGGSPDRPIPITTPAELKLRHQLVTEAKRRGAWGPGLISYLGWNPGCACWVNRDVNQKLWPVWLLVAPELVGEPPPPPPPSPPSPTPPPPPPPEPECEPLDSSRFLRLCEESHGGSPELCQEKAERNPGSTLAKLLARVCPWQVPQPPPAPVPDPPPVTSCPPGETCRPPCPECPGEPESCVKLDRLTEAHAAMVQADRVWTLERCIAALPSGQWRKVPGGKFCESVPAWRARRMAELEGEIAEARERCREDRKRFLPGVMSTGHLEVERVQGGRP